MLVKDVVQYDIELLKALILLKFYMQFNMVKIYLI